MAVQLGRQNRTAVRIQLLSTRSVTSELMTFNYGRFHQKHGASIQILEDGRVARRVDRHDNGMVFGEQPISIGNMFQVKILEEDESWHGALVRLEST